MQLDKFAAIRQQMATLDEADPLPITQTEYGGYHQAAAVLDYFDPVTIQPTNQEADDFTVLLGNCDPVPVNENRHWRLRDSFRSTILRQMGTPAALLNALATNEPRPQTERQRMFEKYVHGTAPPLAQQSRQELSATFEIIDWLRGVKIDLPRPEEVRQWHDRLILYQPLEKMANDTFSGREDELATLQQFVNTQRDSFVPLNIYGPGGMGKSTLIARFILDNRDTLAWVYIDFDRPVIQPQNPLTLLIEGVRQIGIQFPDARERCEMLQQVWRDELAQDQYISSQKGGTSRRALFGYAGSFINLLRSLRPPADTPAPVLLVLDTFEQVQRRSPVAVNQILSLMEQLHQEGRAYTPQVPVHVVVSGRAPLFSTLVKPDPVILLGDFKPEAVKEFLSKKKNLPAHVADFLAKNVGGSPLSLILACEWWQRTGRPEDLEALFGNLAELAYEERQGVLFARLLGVIDDQDVQKLAFPGLVLRRITPDLILDVLAEPCGIEMPADPDEALMKAGEIFQKLSVEVTLVEDEGNEVLRHRPDVRQVMLRLMREQNRHVQKQIARNAVNYYARRNDPISRAEEIYHRLALKDKFNEIDTRWGDGRNIDIESLLDALDELGPSQRAWLAGKIPGISLTPEEQAEARLADWELDTEERVVEWLELNEPQEALQRLRERPERTAGSPLYALEAQVHEALGDYPAALSKTHTGITESVAANEFATAIELAILQAGIARRSGDTDLARRSLDKVQNWVDLRNSGPFYRIQIDLERWQLSGTDRPDDEMQRRLARWFARLEDKYVVTRPGLMGALAGAVGVEHDQVLWRILALTGLEGEQRALLRALGRAVAAWDREYSKAHDVPAGELQRRFQVPEQKGGLEASWSAFWLDAHSAERVNMVSRMREIEPRLTRELREGLVAILAARQQPAVTAETKASGQSVDSNQSTRGTSPPEKAVRDPAGESVLRLTGEQIQRLRQAILNSFMIDELRQTLLYRLEVDLDSIAYGRQLDIVVFRLIEFFQQRNKIYELVSALREARPNDIIFHELMQELSAEPVGDQQIVESLTKASNYDPVRFREKLARMEFQIGQVFIKDKFHGIATLTGPGSVLTSYHVVEDMIKGVMPIEAISFRFELSGEIYHPAREWLVAFSPYHSADQVLKSESDISPADALDYALISLAGDAGLNPIGLGSGGLESVAEIRGWIELEEAGTPVEQATMFIANLDGSGLLKLVAVSDIKVDSDQTRLNYLASPGTIHSGAPCFDVNFNLIGIHQGHHAGNGDSQRYQAISAKAIWEHFRKSGRQF